MKNNELVFTIKKENAKVNVNPKAFNTEIESITYDGLTGTITFHEDLKEIVSNIFSNNNDIDSIELPDSIESFAHNCLGTGITIKGKNVLPEGNAIVKDDTLLYVALSWDDTEYSVPEGIKAIGKSALSQQLTLKKVQLPDSLERIEDSAFSDCEEMSSIKFPKGLKYIGDKAFYGTKLGSLKITDEIISVGNHAFSNCEKLKTVTIGKKVESIGYGAFAGCPKLTTFKGKFASKDGKFIIDGNVLLAAVNGVSDVTIPDNIEEIAPFTFANNSDITSIKLPEGLKVIGEEAFAYISFNIKLPSQLEKIGRLAFIHNHNIESITIPDSVKEIGDGIFKYCRSLKEIKGKFATSDGKYLVEGNRLIAAAGNDDKVQQIPEGIKVIDKGAFAGAQIYGDFIIPEGVEKICESAFQDQKCANISLPSSLRIIEKQAFYGFTICEGALALPEGVTSIGNMAFNHTEVNSNIVTLPSTITEIEEGAFTGMIGENGSPKEITFEVTSAIPPKITTGTIFNEQNIIKLPLKSKDQYEQANGWKEMPNPKEYI